MGWSASVLKNHFFRGIIKIQSTSLDQDCVNDSGGIVIQGKFFKN